MSSEYTESEAMRDWLVRNGVDAGRIVVDTHARDTVRAQELQRVGPNRGPSAGLWSRSTATKTKPSRTIWASPVKFTLARRVLLPPRTRNRGPRRAARPD